jgi:hypothetical protein
MVYWLLAELLPIRLIALIVLVGLTLQFGGVDVFGFTTTNLIDPFLSWLTEEFTTSIWPW